MAMKYVHVILIFIPLVSAAPEAFNYGDIIQKKILDANLNDYMDRSIPQISQFIVKHGLDPLNLPQVNKKLWMELSNVNNSEQVETMLYKADLVLRSGILKYLSNLKRYGNATMNYKNKVLRLDVAFEFELLQGTYDFIVKLVFFNLEGHILASTASVRTKINVTFNVTNTFLSLDKFDLEVPSKIKVVIENKNGQVDWIKTFIVKVITPFFKSTITNVVQKEAMNAIQTYLDEINQIFDNSV